jgi:hypothetical protein
MTGEIARLRELLAEAAHDLWCEWMSYYLRGHFRCRWTENDYDRWDLLAHTPYSELTERERASDHNVSSRLILPVVQPLLDRLEAAERRVAELEASHGCTTEDCAICGQSVCTLEDCPRHPDGCELRDGRWVCCAPCWDEAARHAEEDAALRGEEE